MPTREECLREAAKVLVEIAVRIEADRIAAAHVSGAALSSTHERDVEGTSKRTEPADAVGAGAEGGERSSPASER